MFQDLCWCMFLKQLANQTRKQIHSRHCHFHWLLSKCWLCSVSHVRSTKCKTQIVRLVVWSEVSRWNQLCVTFVMRLHFADMLRPKETSTILWSWLAKMGMDSYIYNIYIFHYHDAQKVLKSGKYQWMVNIFSDH